MSARLSRLWLRSIIHIRPQQPTRVLRQANQNVEGFRRFKIAQLERRANEGSPYNNSSKVRPETAAEQRRGRSKDSSHKPESGEADGGKARAEDPASNTASGGGDASAGAGEVFADKFAKGFSFASASATAGFKKLRDAKIVDALKGSYTFLKEELNTPASRRKVKEASAPFSHVEKSAETAIVPVIKKKLPWQKGLDDIMEKARQHPAYRRLRSVKQHPVVAKSQELAEDLRERWETSDSPVVHKIQDLKDSLFGETATAVATREIQRRDPLFSVPDFILEVHENVRPSLKAYLKAKQNVRGFCGFRIAPLKQRGSEGIPYSRTAAEEDTEEMQKAMKEIKGCLNTMEGRLNTIEGLQNNMDVHLNKVRGQLNTMGGHLSNMHLYLAGGPKKQILFAVREVLKWMGGRRPQKRAKSFLFTRIDEHHCHAGRLLGFHDGKDFVTFARSIVDNRNDVVHVCSLDDLDEEVESACRVIALYPSLKQSQSRVCDLLLKYDEFKREIPTLFA